MSTLTKREWIAEQAKEHPERVFTSLHHLIDLEWMIVAYQLTRKDGAVGVDGVTAAEYEENLESNLEDLLNRIKSGRYKAPPVRRHYIPKADGTQRPLGIPTFEDKVAQRAILMLLESIYEEDFRECSYGFRPGRGAHGALDAIWAGVMKERQRWVIDADIRKYFDSIDHTKLREFLDLRIKDGVIRRMIDKWLKAGVLEEGQLRRTTEGTPQGGVITPRTLLATLSLTVKSNTGDLFHMLTSTINRSIYMLHGEIIKYSICSASECGIYTSFPGSKPRRGCKRNDAVPGALKTTGLPLSGRCAETLRASCDSRQQGNPHSKDFQTSSSYSTQMGSQRWMYAKRLCSTCAGRGNLKTWQKERLKRFPRVVRWYLNPYLTVLRRGSWFGHSGLWFQRICC